MTDTVHLGLPYIETAQAQKHVTHNEALRALDALVMLSVLDRDLSAPPEVPEEGDRYLVNAPGTGAFEDMDDRIAHFVDGQWTFFTPRAGWVCYVADEGALLAHDGEAWGAALDVLGGVSELQELSLLGIGTEADGTNPLSAKLNNVLWTARSTSEGGDGDLRYKLSKETDDNTLSMLFQTGFSGRAEIGLTGDDDFHFKVSADGTTWADALLIDKTTGSAKFNSGMFLTADIAPSTITADVDDYDPAGLATASVLRLTSDASRNITGLAGGSDGRIVTIVNAGTNPIVLLDSDAASATGNRFGFADTTLAPRQSAVLWYDGADSLWRLLAAPAAGGGAGPADLAIVLAEMAMQAAASSGAAVFWGNGGNRFADSFGALTYVDTAATTNLDSGTAGLLKPTASTSTTGTFALTATSQGGMGGSDGSAGLQFTAPATSTIATVRLSVAAVTASGGLTARLYTNNSGSPGTQIGSDSGTVAVSSTGNVTLTFSSSPAMTSATVYWLVLVASGGLNINLDTVADTAGYGSGRNATITSIVDNLGSGREWKVEINYGVGVNNLTVASTAVTALAVRTGAYLAARIKPVNAVTLNTNDLRFDVTRDGGTTWTEFTMSDVCTQPGSIHVLESAVLDISAQPSGASMKWRERTATGKLVELHDVYLHWT